MAATSLTFQTREKHVAYMSDELQLLVRAQALEPAALEEIHRTYYTPIFRFVAQKVSNRQLAEDLASEVFVRLLDALRDRTAPNNSLRGWLYAVASRVVNDHYRKVYRHQRYEAKLDPENAVRGMDKGVERQIDLHEALSMLTPEQQDVVALRFGAGLRIQEVAETIGKTEGAVKQLQARALRSLAKQLGEQPT